MPENAAKSHMVMSHPIMQPDYLDAKKTEKSIGGIRQEASLILLA